jgi:hypothetical protein
MNDPVKQFLPAKYHNMRRRFMAHQVEFNTLAALSPGQSEKFSQDSGTLFLCLALDEVITQAADGASEQTFPEHLVQIQNSSSGVLWTLDGFQHAGNLFGRNVVDGAGPLKLPYPQIVRPGETVIVTAQNLENNARRIWMGFLGVQVFLDTDWREQP